MNDCLRCGAIRDIEYGDCPVCKLAEALGMKAEWKESGWELVWVKA